MLLISMFDCAVSMKCKGCIDNGTKWTDDEYRIGLSATMSSLVCVAINNRLNMMQYSLQF